MIVNDQLWTSVPKPENGNGCVRQSPGLWNTPNFRIRMGVFDPGGEPVEERHLEQFMEAYLESKLS